METWKIRTTELEQRLSQFYWPLYMRFQRDDLVWEKVFHDLRPKDGRVSPDWVAKVSDEDRQKLAQEIEEKVLVPNHAEAASIIRSGLYRANADQEFEDLLARYLRHVDAYASLRSAGIRDVTPTHIGEPYPNGLSEAVSKRLRKYQAEYEAMLRDHGVLDLSRTSRHGHRVS
jgi:hypothetical protein